MPTTTAYLAAHAALTAADALDDATACTCGPADATCAGCDARAAYRAALRAYDAAHAAWLASDEPRAWETGGESWGGGSGDRIEDVPPSEIEQHLEDGARDGDWAMDGGTLHVRDWAAPIDPATGAAIEAAQVDVTTTIEPTAPTCARGRDHQWRSPYGVLGGIAENPGVWGKGGGVIIREVCAHCACYRVTDTWAQDRSTGEQGLTEVSYEEADEDSLAWVAAQRDAAMAEACPYSLDPHDRRGPGSYLVGVEADADDCEACDAILAQVREAIGPGWSVGWAGSSNGNESDLSIEWEGQA